MKDKIANAISNAFSYPNKTLTNYKIHSKDDPRYYDYSYRNNIRDNAIDIPAVMLLKNQKNKIVKENLMPSTNLLSRNKTKRINTLKLSTDIKRSNLIHATPALPIGIRNNLKSLKAKVEQVLESIDFSNIKLSLEELIVPTSSGKITGTIGMPNSIANMAKNNNLINIDSQKNKRALSIKPYRPNREPIKTRLPNWH